VKERKMLVSGIADAAAVGRDGAIEAVIDWKSDIHIDESVLSNYRKQVQAYCEATGAARGMLVLMSHGRIIDCRS
jgi:hypothetical protein